MTNCSELFRLRGKTAIVTGSARGLGKEIALSLAQNGCSLVLSDIVPPDETEKEIRDIGSQCISVKTDISDEMDEKMLETMEGVSLEGIFPGKTKEELRALLYPDS